MKFYIKKLMAMMLFICVLCSFIVPVYASENYTSQIAINLTVPENFDLPCYATFYNVTLDEDFTINLIKENNYRGRMNVPAGDYLVGQIQVVDDLTCKYPFLADIEDFTLSDNNNQTVQASLLNYDEVQEQINNYINSETSQVVSSESIEPIEEESSEEVVIEPQEEEKQVPIFLIIIIVVAIVLFIGFIIYCIYKHNQD